MNYQLLQIFYKIDIIGLQEVWSIGSNIDSLDIPGFQRLTFKSRFLNRGGGVGFYVRSGFSTKIIEELSVFQDGIFESICIELGYSTGKVVRFVSIYRPPDKCQFRYDYQFLIQFFDTVVP